MMLLVMVLMFKMMLLKINVVDDDNVNIDDDENVVDEKVVDENVDKNVDDENVDENVVDENVDENVDDENVDDENVDENVVDENVDENVVDENVDENVDDENVDENVFDDNVDAASKSPLKFLHCLSNFKVSFCEFPLQDVTDSKNQSLVLKPANFTNTSLSVTCGYNTNFSSIQCNKSDNSSATQLGIFNIDVHEANRTNITIFLNWKSSLKVTELRWADFLDVHFVCLADDKAGDLVKMSLPLQIAGASMALVIIIMFTITVCRSLRRRRQLEEKLKLIPETEVELEHTKTFSSQIRLITDTTDIPVPEENTIVVKF
ncbi:hypothetical protein BgiBS90_028972 [Biomphalaria glabrata]|nr:hypothetical protein BgiBS90_028972 [Biomphalaria glabrata]